jgi:hypothetical protein
MGTRQAQRDSDRRLRTALILAVGASAAAFAAIAALHLANEFLLDERFWHLNADADGNAMTWASVLATAAAGALALMLAQISPQRRRSLALLGTLLVFFAADDAFGIHEDLGMVFAYFGLPDIAGIWFPIYLPVFGFCAFVLWTLTWPGPPAVTLVRLGLVLLGIAIVGEALTAGAVPAIDRSVHSLGYEIEVAFEEAAELAGWVAVACGLAVADLVARRAAVGETEAAPQATAV